MEIDRRALLRAGAATLIATGCCSKSEETPIAQPPAPVFPLSEPLTSGVGLTGLPYPELAELSIADLSTKLAHGELTSVVLVQRYRARITALDDKLRAVIELNPDADRSAA